jgi:hypothetical protein
MKHATRVVFWQFMGHAVVCGPAGPKRMILETEVSGLRKEPIIKQQGCIPIAAQPFDTSKWLVYKCIASEMAE